MTQSFEIVGKFDHESDCHKLLYAPLTQPSTYRETMLYRFDYEGSDAALADFVAHVLVDPISQEARSGGEAMFKNAAFVLEYGMKGGALDLEKETILQYFRAMENPGFTINKLALRRRIYVFGEHAEAAPFVRDVCNPAIHTWEVLKAA